MRVIRSRFGGPVAGLPALIVVTGVAVGICVLAWTPAIGGLRLDQPLEQASGAELSNEQIIEARKLVDIVESAMRNEPSPADFALGWNNDFLKAQEGKTYVPFTVSIAPGTIDSGPFSMFLRVVERGRALADDAAGGDAEEVTYPFEDVHFIDLRPVAAGEPQRISRAFAVSAGAYDVYIAMKDSELAEAPAEPIRRTLTKVQLDVPDFWSGELTTSSVILAERVEPLSAPLTAEQQALDPYALGTTRIVPALDADYAKSDELSLIFLIYNPRLDGSRKPDLLVDYNFYQATEDGEEFFNKTNPQAFNAETLPPQFDLEAGHQLVAGQSVPLASFPAGDYRLEITITDNESGATIGRDVTFNVGEL